MKITLKSSQLPKETEEPLLLVNETVISLKPGVERNGILSILDGYNQSNEPPANLDTHPDKYPPFLAKLQKGQDKFLDNAHIKTTDN